jgi:outer membrane immunogenic protein
MDSVDQAGRSFDLKRSALLLSGFAQNTAYIIMKTIYPLLLLSLLSLAGMSTLNAQMTDGKPRFGIKAGVNGSSLYDDANASDKETRIGITGGVFAQIPFNKGRMALRPELLFTTKGGAYDFANNTIRPDYQINYVELPLSLEYRFLGVINIHGGGYASLLVTGDGKIEGVQTTLAKANFEDFDFGWHAGAGIDIGAIGLHFRMSRGLQNISKENVNVFLGDLKNSSWAVTLSYGL